MAAWRDWPHVYLHVDMDAFFVSVELLRRPDLRGQPVIVATGTDASARGVVMAASYEARRFGVHSALPLAIAHRRCPQAVLLPRDLALYRRASAAVMEVLRRFSDRVEVAGLDEAYLDLSGSPAPKARARQLKGEVRAATGLVCSVGLAPNKLLAKVASDLEKPDGLCVLEPDRMLEVVGDRQATLIPGVGERTAERLDRARDPDGGRSRRRPGPHAGAGIGAAAGPPAARARSRPRRASGWSPTESASRRAARPPFPPTSPIPRRFTAPSIGWSSPCVGGSPPRDVAGRTVTLKIRLRPFRTHTRSRTLDEPTRDPDRLRAVSRELLAAFELDAPVRLLGVGVSGLVRAGDGEPAHRPGPVPAQGSLAIEA